MKYILFGASDYMRKNIDEEKIKYFEYIVDNDPGKIGTAYLGKEIKSPEVLLDEDKNNIFIVISAFGQLYSIEYDLTKMGFEKGVNFEWIGRLYNHYPEHSLWLRPYSEYWNADENAWRDKYANFEPYERAELVAKMIDWKNVKSVLDLGAGSEPMRPLIDKYAPNPGDVSYYPVDYKQLTGNTLVYDFNKKQFPDISADAVVLIGVHGYVDYEQWLIEKAAEAVNPGGQLVISMNYFTGGYHVLDFITKHCDTFKCDDYAFRSDIYGIFRMRRNL